MQILMRFYRCENFTDFFVLKIFIKFYINSANNKCVQVAQLSQRDRAAGRVSHGQKWKTGTGRIVTEVVLFSIFAFKTLDISQGSVATDLRYGGIFSDVLLHIFSWFW